MQRKLKPYATDDEAERVVRRLVELKLLNDIDFSAGYASYRLRERGLGSLRIRNELRERGVSQGDIQHALAVATTELSEEEAALEVARKYLRKKPFKPGPKEVRRLMAYLARAGYPHECARKALVRLGFEDIDWSAE